MVKSIQRYAVENEWDVMVVQKGPGGGPGKLYRAVRMTEKSVLLGWWFDWSTQEWCAFTPEGRAHWITRDQVFAVVESVEECRQLVQMWKHNQEEFDDLLQKQKAELAPLNERHCKEVVELLQGQADRLAQLMGV